MEAVAFSSLLGYKRFIIDLMSRENPTYMLIWVAFKELQICVHHMGVSSLE